MGLGRMRHDDLTDAEREARKRVLERLKEEHKEKQKARSERKALEQRLLKSAVDELQGKRKEAQNCRQELKDLEQRAIEESKKAGKYSAKILEGQELYAAGRYDDAIKFLTTVLTELHPPLFTDMKSDPVNEGTARQYLAFSYLKRGNDVQGMHELETARACLKSPHDAVFLQSFNLEAGWFLEEYFELRPKEGRMVPEHVSPELVKHLDGKLDEGFRAYYTARTSTHQYEPAINAFAELSQALAKCNWPRMEAIARKELGCVYHESGNRTLALSEFETAKRLFRESAEPMQYQDFEKQVEAFLKENE